MARVSGLQCERYFILTANVGDTIIRGLSVGLRPLVKTLPTAGKVGAKVLILGNNLTGTTSVSFSPLKPGGSREWVGPDQILLDGRVNCR